MKVNNYDVISVKTFSLQWQMDELIFYFKEADKMDQSIKCN